MDMDKNTMTTGLIVIVGLVALSQVASVIYSTFFDASSDQDNKKKIKVIAGSKKAKRHVQPDLVIVGPSGSGKTALF